MSNSKETPIIPIHQWTNGGDEVLVVRFVSKDGKSYGGFQHPMTIGEIVTAPYWQADCRCGGGIHAWPWALGIGEGKECDWSALWQVYGVKPEDIMQGNPDLVGKIKFRTGVLRFLGKWDQATDFVLSGQMAWVHQAARGAASATGWSGAASATGKDGTACALGVDGKASGSLGNFLVIAEWKCVDSKWKRVAMGLAKVDGKKIKADTFYALKSGKFVEVQ